jgi:Cof subfamily protein (haloacid dehalogenase superfamily)
MFILVAVRYWRTQARWNLGKNSGQKLGEIKLVFIDADGTLVGVGGVPGCVWPAVSRAQDARLELGLCTGRPARAKALDYATRLGEQGFHIFESGAVILKGNRVVHSSILPQDTYLGLLEVSQEHGIPFEVYTSSGGFFVQEAHPDLLAHEELLGVKAHTTPLEALEEVVRVQYVWRSHWAAARRLVAAMKVDLHEATSPIMPGVGFSSVTLQGVSKRAAALWVAKQHGLGLANVAMIGDGENDLGLIQAAGLGIAMGNAHESVKAAAAWEVAHVDDCGLAEALDRLIALPREA